MRYIVHFVYIDPSGDNASPEEKIIIEADSARDAGKIFYRDSDNQGCYIEAILPLLEI